MPCSTTTTTVDFTQTTPRIKKKLVEGIEQGFIKCGWNSDAGKLFMFLHKEFELGYLRLDGWYFSISSGLTLPTNFRRDVAEAVVKAFRTHEVTETLAGRRTHLDTSGIEAFIAGKTDYLQTGNWSYFAIRDACKQIVETPEYKARVAPLLAAIHEGQTFEIHMTKAPKKRQPKKPKA